MMSWADTGAHVPSGGGSCWLPVGAAPQPSQVTWKPPSVPCNTGYWRQQFYFWSDHGHCGSLPKAAVHFRMGRPCGMAWAGINKQRAVCPNSRSLKVNQSNWVSVDWQAGGTAVCSCPVSQVLTCKGCLGFDNGTCTVFNLKCMMQIRHYIHQKKELQCTVYHVVCFCTIVCYGRSMWAWVSY